MRSSLIVVACVATVMVTGCGIKSGRQEYEDKLADAGFENVSVTRDEEGAGKKKLVAYDYDYLANTDADEGTCVVELEHPASAKGALSGDHWHIDEVNGGGVDGWGDESPDATAVRQLLQQHGFDC